MSLPYKYSDCAATISRLTFVSAVSNFCSSSSLPMTFEACAICRKSSSRRLKRRIRLPSYTSVILLWGALAYNLHELPQCRRRLIALLLEDETTQGSRALFGGKLVEEAVEEQLTEHQFITGTDLTGDASLELHHVCFVDEAQATKNSSSVLELLHLQNRHGITDLLSDLLDLVAKLNLVLVLGVESRQSRRAVTGSVHEFLSLTYAEQLLEAFISPCERCFSARQDRYNFHLALLASHRRSNTRRKLVVVLVSRYSDIASNLEQNVYNI
ncbi:hypothetical protein KCU83_g32, partial [Aureobasidium melanogenum]